MNRPLVKALRILPFASALTLGALAAASCNERAAHEHAAVLPKGQPAVDKSSDAGVTPSSTVDPTARPDPAAPDPPPIPCSAGGEACPDGFMCCPQCCLANLPPVCVPKTDGGCSLPDLSVDVGALAMNAFLDTIDGDPCERDEACLLGPGKRKVLRFDVQIPNQGARDLVLGNPDAGGPFIWGQCHKHYHFTGFARYQLVSETDDKVVLTGRKQAFCARDSVRVAQNVPFAPGYDCTMQGISVGWADIYDHTIPCQYLDVTDVPSGDYRLEVEVNPERTITEARYDNNVARIKIKLP
jgi:hypothetical protein